MQIMNFVNSCSYSLGVGTAQINNLNVRAINNLGNLNADTINTSLITNVSCINCELNQNLDIIANRLNLFESKY